MTDMATENRLRQYLAARNLGLMGLHDYSDKPGHYLRAGTSWLMGEVVPHPSTLARDEEGFVSGSPCPVCDQSGDCTHGAGCYNGGEAVDDSDDGPDAPVSIEFLAQQLQERTNELMRERAQNDYWIATLQKKDEEIANLQVSCKSNLNVIKARDEMLDEAGDLNKELCQKLTAHRDTIKALKKHLDTTSTALAAADKRIAELVEERKGLDSRLDAALARADRAEAAPSETNGFNIADFLARQWAWSRETFGPYLRTKGVIQHITKELVEVEKKPFDLSEWADIIILALDGFWRHGGSPEGLGRILEAKYAKNVARTWPDWRTMSSDQAIEHNRSGE